LSVTVCEDLRTLSGAGSLPLGTPREAEAALAYQSGHDPGNHCHGGYHMYPIARPHTAAYRALLAALALLVLGVSSSAHAQQGGPPTNRIYANDELFTGVNAPRDLPNQGMFDTIYVLGSGLASVADAAPGDQDFNGGRWEVHMITWNTIEPTQFTNDEQVEAAAAAGQITIGDVVRRFECPLVPMRGNR
jgi:hypothetical protein